MITKELLRAARADIEAALAPVGQKHGLTFTTGKIGYTEESFKVSVEAVLIGGKGTEARLLESCGYGFTAGQTVTFKQGEVLTITGANRAGTVLLANAKGARFTAKAEAVKRALARNTAAQVQA